MSVRVGNSPSDDSGHDAVSQRRVRLPVIVMLGYFWWLICTPVIRLPILGDLYFEKVIAAAWLMSVLTQGEKPPVFASFITKSLLFLFLLLTVLSNFSGFPDTLATIQWTENYWKVVFFYIMAILSIRDRTDFLHTVSGMVIIVYAYQILSWRDFLAGGSYVYQQGIKRMTGMWVENSYGAANYWGSLSALTAPFAFYCYRRWTKHWAKLSILPLCMLLLLSVVFSGSRGSLITLIAFLLFSIRKRIWHPKYIVVFLAVAAVGLVFMPEEYKERYSMILIDKSEIDSGTKDEQNAKESAAGRIQGLIDGWNIMVKYPLGTGPAQSAVVRMEVNRKLAAGGEPLQLHNLYGQVFAETGVIGTLIVFLLWFRMYRFLSERKSRSSITLEPEKEAILGAMVVMLIYGMANHSLYTYWWIWLYSFTTAILYLARELNHDESGRGPNDLPRKITQA